MRTLSLKAAVALSAAFAFGACQSPGSGRVTQSSASSTSSDAPQIRFTPAPDGTASFVDVVGLPSATLRALQQRPPADEDWPAVFRVSIGGVEVRPDLPPVAGRYSVGSTAIRFVPLFPLDAGRAYRVTFDPSRLRGEGGEPIASAAERIETTINTPGVEGRPTTRVEAVYPSGEVVPENQLRLYIFFTAPMDRVRRPEWISLVDDAGRTIDNPFLPLDVGLWNADRTRFTVLFDPGRVKQGVLPNEQLGRSIRRGQKYTLVIDRAWRDARGQPLVESYRRTFRVSEPIEVAIDPSMWRLEPPTKSGGIDSLVASFPSALDYALMQRAISVRDAKGRRVPGTVSIEAHETRWRFVPDMPWLEGAYNLEIQSILEDPSGNRIGRPFELVNAAPAPIAEDSRPTLIPFRITAGAPFSSFLFGPRIFAWPVAQGATVLPRWRSDGCCGRFDVRVEVKHVVGVVLGLDTGQA